MTQTMTRMTPTGKTAALGTFGGAIAFIAILVLERNGVPLNSEEAWGLTVSLGTIFSVIQHYWETRHGQ